ncbi:MAG: hypothetical protein M3266_00050, partial [Actinomycetota bacterium]|nr:hypothetical protein [Actinomycetota bacterium]
MTRRLSAPRLIAIGFAVFMGLGTILLKDLKVPMLFSRANNELHARVLDRVGADHVIQPEKEFGEFLARQMSVPGIQDYL